MSLPIEDIFAPLRAALAAGSAAVVQAPPGAGKSTLLPLALLDQPWLARKRLLMLEPRRLAARLVAKRLAQNLGESVGQTVGFRVRDETRIGRDTRLEVVTEGILTRMLQHDPTLEGIGAVLFDEFHERSLQADLGLALTLDVQANLRPDLRILAMSATLDGAAVAKLLGGASILTSEGRAFPVETIYVPPPPGLRLEQAIADLVGRALREQSGDILVFLPGVGEIGRVQRLLSERALPGNVEIVPLYGELPADQQDRAVAPAQAERRRVVLATAIAETSLTIDGVRVVVDSGLARHPAFEPRSGMSRLITVRGSLASADQRRGRAGRTQPGICYRLWPEAENRGLAAQTAPEIENADLAPLALDLALWGEREPAHLRWVTPPPEGAYAQARELLRHLGALDGEGGITAHGKAMAAMPAHPRLAHMMVRAREMGAGVTACRLAALLEERDILRARAGGARQADLRLRLEALAALEQGRRFADRDLLLNDPAARRAVRLAERFRRLAGIGATDDDAAQTGLLVALAYPDRIARRRGGSAPRYLLANGRGAALRPDDRLAGEAWLAIADLDGAGAESSVYLAAPLDQADAESVDPAAIVEQDVVEWDDRAQKVLAVRQRRLGAIVLKETPLKQPPAPAVARALLAALSRRGIGQLAFGDAAQALRQRVAFLRRLAPDDWPDFSDAALAATLEQWLAPSLAGLKSLAEITPALLDGALRGQLEWKKQKELDRLAPSHFATPIGTQLRIDYGDPAEPALAVRLQELFGLSDTPRMAGGKVPLTLHLLSPAGRPIQVTADLGRFWQSSYAEVRKEMRGRYPKHNWPEDPLAAAPSRTGRKPRR